MSKTNKEVVQGFLEEVINAKRLDRLYEFFNPDSVVHMTSYVGLGFALDDSTIGKNMIRDVIPGSPAAGKLQPGDQIISIADEHNTWDTYEQIHRGEAAHGAINSPVTYRVLRNGKTLEFTLTRELLHGFDLIVAQTESGLRDFFADWPDMQVKIDCMVAEDDLVSVFSTNSGTSKEYNCHAVWAQFDLYRVRDGKIVESWGIEDEITRMKQEGYSFRPPVN